MKIIHCIALSPAHGHVVSSTVGIMGPSRICWPGYIHPQTDFHNGPFYACLPTCLNIPHFTSSHFRLPKCSHTQSGSWKYGIFVPQLWIWKLQNLSYLSSLGSKDNCKKLFFVNVFFPQTVDHFSAKQFGIQPINWSCKQRVKLIQPIHDWFIKLLSIE